MSPHLIAAFITTFFFVSLTPGMCMTLAISLGMTIGVKRTCWMMVGELIGVGLVAIAAVVGVAAILFHYPLLFHILKYAGGAYLIYLGYKLWRDKSRLTLETDTSNNASHTRVQLALQGFITAVANPKGWVFMISLLPPFIDPTRALVPQLSILVGIILSTEFTCLMLYASGGQTLRQHLSNSGHMSIMNRISGSLMAMVGLWLMMA
ncbi:LysE family translocator [Celerinatantimonas sp. YJH-8]|uniref:LysE family translocator n=1 Tax=Celerinatantimonas sp. YJH-8 TaxID=3228714 RepID=UPI0038C40D89